MSYQSSTPKLYIKLPGSSKFEFADAVNSRDSVDLPIERKGATPLHSLYDISLIATGATRPTLKFSTTGISDLLLSASHCVNEYLTVGLETRFLNTNRAVDAEADSITQMIIAQCRSSHIAIGGGNVSSQQLTPYEYRFDCWNIEVYLNDELYASYDLDKGTEGMFFKGKNFWTVESRSGIPAGF